MREWLAVLWSWFREVSIVLVMSLLRAPCHADVETGLLHIQLLKRSRKGRYLLPRVAERLGNRDAATETHLTLLGACLAAPCDDSKAQEGGAEASSACDAVEGGELVGGQVQSGEASRPACAADTYWARLLVAAPAESAASSGLAPCAYYLLGGEQDVEL